MNGREARKILEKYREELGINEKVHLRFKPMKTKAASCNISRRIIYINSYLKNLDSEVIEYLILHELVHIKLGIRQHCREFDEIIYRFFPRERVVSIRERIMKALIEVNGGVKRLNLNMQENIF